MAHATTDAWGIAALGVALGSLAVSALALFRGTHVDL